MFGTTMRVLALKSLPFALAAIPIFIFVLSAIAELKMFDWLRDTSDMLLSIFLPAMLIYDALGIIHFSALSGANLLGSKWLALAVCVLTTALAFYFLGATIRALAGRA